MPKKELEEVPMDQMEDLKMEDAGRSLLEEEHAMHVYHNSRRHKSEGNEWMKRYKSSRSEIHVESFQDEQSFSDHVHEAEKREQYMNQLRLRRLKRIQGQ